jgi:hypothetical protein
MAGIGAVLGVIFLVVAGVARFFGSLQKEVAAAEAKQKPWLWLLVFWPACIGNFVVGGLAALRWWKGGISYGDAMSTVPFWSVPVMIMFAAIIVAAIESAHDWLPKVPVRAAAFIRGWLMLIGGPVLGPLGCWQSIQEARAKGEQIGALSAGNSLIGTFAVSILLWLLAVLMPFALVSVLLVESFR